VTYKDQCNDASQTVKKSGKGMKVEKDEFLSGGGKSAVMTMRRVLHNSVVVLLTVSFMKF